MDMSRLKNPVETFTERVLKDVIETAERSKGDWAHFERNLDDTYNYIAEVRGRHIAVKRMPEAFAKDLLEILDELNFEIAFEGIVVK